MQRLPRTHHPTDSETGFISVPEMGRPMAASEKIVAIEVQLDDPPDLAVSTTSNLVAACGGQWAQFS
jgi:hypothetical protein